MSNATLACAVSHTYEAKNNLPKHRIILSFSPFCTAIGDGGYIVSFWSKQKHSSHAIAAVVDSVPPLGWKEKWRRKNSRRRETTKSSLKKIFFIAYRTMSQRKLELSSVWQRKRVRVWKEIYAHSFVIGRDIVTYLLPMRQHPQEFNWRNGAKSREEIRKLTRMVWIRDIVYDRMSY